jgi:hypothetical protein
MIVKLVGAPGRVWIITMCSHSATKLRLVGVSPNLHYARTKCCDRGYGRPFWHPRVLAPGTYRSLMPRHQHPAVARWHAHLRDLETLIHETTGLCGRAPEGQNFKPVDCGKVGEGRVTDVRPPVVKR